MFEYEIIKQRNAELQKQARHAVLVREARSGDTRPGVLRRLAQGVRLSSVTHIAEPRAARLGEC